VNAFGQAGLFALVMCAPVILIDLAWQTWIEERDGRA
jgi:hypothetical protein